MRFLSCLAMVLLGAGSAHAKVRVVTTLPDLAALAAEVGGDLVEVTALAAPSMDPHFVDARPSFIVPLSRADLLVYNGVELEIGWLPPLLVNARNGAIQAGGAGHLDVSKAVRRMEIPAGRIDRSMGDIHPGGNPHFLLDPRAAARVASAIGQRLAALDAPNTETYLRSASRVAQMLDAVARDGAERLARLPVEKRRIVTYHRSLTYLVDWLGLEVVAEVEPKPGIAPSPKHIASVLSTMRAQGVKAIFQEEWYPRSTSETLGKLAGAKVLAIRGGTRFEDGEKYGERMRKLISEVEDALGR